MCGEKGALAGWAAARAGSPPRVRGKALQAIPAIMSEGITPACAGKRIGRLQCRTSRKDHPRVCGEKFPVTVPDETVLGSPPRMRGKVENTVEKHTDHRITPAYAGKSYAPAFSFPILEDHPRVCGEKLSGCVWLRVYGGSPPRMRGKGRRWPESVAANGITPAYAGKRSFRC